MLAILNIYPELAWIVVIMFAWFSGEYIHRWTQLPRISIYGLVGFLFASSQMGVLPTEKNEMVLLLANIAFGLILFEAGYRINLKWLFTNHWIAISSLAEAALTFIAVYFSAVWASLEITNALLLAALAMSTSPAAIIRVINEQRSTGQVTERTLHLSVLNCVIAALMFKAIVGLHVFQASGSIWQAGYSSIIVLLTSAMMGWLCGVVLPALLRYLGRFSQDGTLAFAMSVILLVTLTHALKLSPIVATLTFGITARHRRVALSQTRRNFGPLGDLLSVLLFVFVASTLEWNHIKDGVVFGVGIILLRCVTKMLGVGVFSYLGGISWRKGLLTGLALSPISVFVILMLEQTRYSGIDLVDQLTSLAAIALVLEILGPVMTQYALIWAKEVPGKKE